MNTLTFEVSDILPPHDINAHLVCTYCERVLIVLRVYAAAGSSLKTQELGAYFWASFWGILGGNFQADMAAVTRPDR